jgi:predicted transposase YbfD/YdcC
MQLRAASIRTASRIDKGHGRRERRTIRTTTWLNGYLDWPSIGQVFHLRRERTIRGETKIEDVYGITSLSPEEAPPEKLLSLIRSHWAIENQLFGVRDWTLGEDASRVRSGNAAQVAAGLRNVALFLLRRLAKRQKQGIADAIRDLRFHVQKAIKLVTT